MSNPDLRFGQLVMVIAQTGEHNPKLFHMEEDELLEKIKVLQNQLKKETSHL
ncbi:hypothetical protein [Elizabethkingia anophelis]|nr:hypothetical protein [Elizabethkingia anophelis]WGL69393.1 hypothetical protein QFB79_16055 [Elizabethkingia anophelis]